MQRFLFIVLLGAVIVSSCKKTPGETTRMALHNATLTVDSLTMLWNGSPAVSTPLAQGKTSGTAAEPYVTLAAGTNNIILRSGTTTLLNKNAFGGVNTSYTLLAYDSLPQTRSLNYIFLTDDLTLTDTLSARFRFINCVYSEVDSILLRSAADTLNLLNIGVDPYFIGPAPTAASLQPFVTIPRGIYVPLVFKLGATTPIAYDSIVFSSQKICSLIYSGKPGSTGADSLQLSVIVHPVN